MSATQTDPEKGVEPLVPGLVRPEPAHYIHILDKPIRCFTLHILGQSVAVFRIRIQPVTVSGSKPRFFMKIFLQKCTVGNFLGVRTRHICPHKPLKETSRLFKQEISNFFPFKGDNF
jgi:hypothetical protein